MRLGGGADVEGVATPELPEEEEEDGVPESTAS